MRVPFRVVVEEHQLEHYAEHLPADQLLVLDPHYQKTYDPLMDLEPGQSLGPGPARNFIWDHAISEGHKWHWVMDDNIHWWARYHRNKIHKVMDGTVFRVMEDFCLRFRNVAMAGPNYEMFVASKEKKAPFVINTRIYSCNLIRNDVPFRWRGRYNEDTILSLDMLKDGWTTIQFNQWVQKKVMTQTMPGGNTEAFYSDEGTLPKSQMLVRAHPDVARLAWRFGRAHHYVNFRLFKQSPIYRDDYVPVDDPDEYGLKLKKVIRDEQPKKKNPKAEA